jgi:phospholipid/cholesterol/gamma-HCH transport system substrate-binding protein
MAIFTRSGTERATLRTAPWPGGNGHRPGPLDVTRTALRRRWWWALAAVVIAAASLAAVDAAAGPSTYPVTARFARAPGLFPGAAVEVLGVPVGTVTSVKNVEDEVVVKLAIDRDHPVPQGVTAALVSPEILGEPSIDLSPGYTGGPALRPGAVIPMSRTAVPVSTEQVLKSLRTTLERINPHAVGNLVSNLAQDLHGQGKNLNALISGAAGTLQILATKAATLGQLNGSLANLTGALDARTAQITRLITDYDTVSAVISQHSAQLGGALVQFSQASGELVQLLVPNLAPLESDTGTITTVGRTLDRNLTSIDQVLASEVALFTGARRVYTPTYNWLTLNAQNPAGLTGAIIASMVRSRLEGVCRRILAHHATGLTAAQRRTLATCGRPSTAFFNGITAQIPAILNDVRAGKLPAPGSPASMFSQGLKKIPGATTTSPKKSTPTTGPGSATSGSGGTGSTPGSGGGGTGGTPSSTTPTCLDGILHILGCGSTSSTGSTSTGSGSSSSGLLSYDVRAPGGASTSALSASAVQELPPLPAGAPGAGAGRRHPRARLQSHRTHRSHRHHRRDAHRRDGRGLARPLDGQSTGAFR